MAELATTTSRPPMHDNVIAGLTEADTYTFPAAECNLTSFTGI
jgi:hypothetical protein